MVDGTLTPTESARVYDRIGRFQDWQRFYEGPAMRRLEAHSRFDAAEAVFELGSGTGAFAVRLLDDLLPGDGTYRGVDVSTRMVDLSSSRLQRFGDRARVDLVDGTPPFPGDDHAFDRYVAVYVFDLLSHDLAVAMLDEARRLLTADGLLCLVALTDGATPASRAVCSLWNAVWRRAPRLVGGCRPTELTGLLGPQWRIEHESTVTAWAVTSQVLVARPRDA